MCNLRYCVCNMEADYFLVKVSDRFLCIQYTCHIGRFNIELIMLYGWGGGRRRMRKLSCCETSSLSHLHSLPAVRLSHSWLVCWCFIYMPFTVVCLFSTSCAEVILCILNLASEIILNLKWRKLGLHPGQQHLIWRVDRQSNQPSESFRMMDG